MRPREKTGGKALKTQRPKTLKRRNTPNSVVSDEVTDVARLTRERDEALEQLAATSEVLQVISKSPGELEPVFEAMLANAARICEARFAMLYLYDGDAFHAVAATHDAPAAYVEARKRTQSLQPTPDTPLGRVASTKQVVHIADLSKLQSYIERHPFVIPAVELGGFRTALGVPLLKDNELVGCMNIFRQEVRPFTDKQIDLVKNFAAQAVIAIENTRLLNELRESLQQQTATADVLKVISSSPAELDPVFNAILENATHICEATFGHLLLREGPIFRAVAIHSKASHVDLRSNPVLDVRENPDTPIEILANTKQVVHIPDLQTDKSYIKKNKRIVPLVEIGGARTFVVVPMLKEDDLIGAISMYRQEVRPFSDKQVELVQNFAAQAVIAIENTRLLNELRQRTDDLSESLEQQTATSDVLKVISSSPGELEPVFNAMLENATRICEAKFGLLYEHDGNAFCLKAHLGADPTYLKHIPTGPFRPDPETLLAQVKRTGEVVQIEDLANTRGYAQRVPIMVAAVELGKVRTFLGVPMIKDGALVGAILLYRREVRPFTDKQIELVKNFAAQAVIAIENTRLLNELQQRTSDLSESLEQQTATSEILSSMSGSMTDTKPVFDAIVHNLLRLFGTRFATVHLLKDGMVHLAALDGEPGFERLAANFPRPLDDSTAGRVMHLKQVLQFAPVIDNPATPPATKRFAREYTFNSILAAPMMRGHEVIGAIVTARRDPIAFDDKQIALIKSFAAQAVIAIENARLLNELRQRTDDLSESLEQQTATSEVLQVISSSPGELEPVFNAMLANATRICGATIGTLYLYEGSRFCGVALHHTKQSYVDWWRRNSVVDVESNSGLPLSRLARTKQTVHIPDLRTDQSYIEKNDRVVNLVEVAGVRTFVSVPMLKEGELIGAINLYRQEVRPFTDKQIELVQNFAAQAVIAIENTRLLNELRESLQQQTATADVLKVISSSPGELEPVFNAMLANATRLCNAEFGTLNLYDGDVFHIEAVHNVPPEFAEARLHELIRPHPSGGHARVIRTKDVVQIEDIRKGQAYLDGDPSVVAVSDLGGARTIILVPMLKDDDVLVGTIAIYRKEVLPFTEKQIELVKNFAAQAVIAIENTRLLNELRESLQQQTATADVLKVISSSPGDLEPVFQAMLQKATQICEAKFGVMFRFADDEFRAISWLANTPAYIIEHPHVVGENPHNFLTRIVSTKRPVHSSDLTKERAYIEGNPRIVALVETAGARSLLVVPMVKNEELIGAIAIYWQEVRSFTEKQIELISNFAAQAVIAIDNARLLSELRESLQQQTATADVLKVISRSTFDLHTVLDTLVESAARLCEADMASINREKGTAYQQVASYGQSPEFQAYMATHPISAGRGSVVGRTVMQGGIVHIPDVLADPDFKMIGAAKVGGIHTMLGVPLLREGTPIGVIVLQRKAVQPFTDKQIELVETFADQAVIAIENTRLLGELRESLQQQTATADVLKVISRSTFDLRTVLQTLIESAARLCDADKGNITREKGGIFYRAAESYGYSPEFLDHIKGMPIEMDRGSATGRSLLEKRVIHIRDAKADPEYTLVEAQRLGDYRTVLAVPMLREGIPLGVLTLTRSEVRPFTDKQIELVTTFADQAAIAIENVRLFESVEARTRELAKSLEDLRTTQDRLVQTQKLASLGQLTAGIAHEIKNPLNFVNNFSGVSAELIDELQDTVKGIPLDDKARAEIKELTDTLKGNLDKIVQHGKRADAIVKNMLLHSREGSGEHRPVDVNALVEESLNLAYHGARAEKQGFTITLQRSFDPTVGEADIFPQDIIRALLNLIINGFYAATKRRAEANGGNYEPTLAAATKNLGDRVEITIRDNGIGVPLDVKEKMFNPFFTTKPAGEGTGLGLSISHDIIVKQHGGSIEVETQPGEFTEIKVILPRVAALLPERL